jgi:hypothetical protein
LLSSLQSGGSAPNAIALPYWDNEQLQLWFGGRVLATLRHRGSYMSEILDAFQRVGWTSRRIANPLSRVSDESNGEAQLRLNNTLKNLNRELLAGTIRFCAEDHGARVRWDYCTTKCAAKRGFTTRFITNRNR